jgi:hypothetical protein
MNKRRWRRRTNGSMDKLREEDSGMNPEKNEKLWKVGGKARDLFTR